MSGISGADAAGKDQEGAFQPPLAEMLPSQSQEVQGDTVRDVKMEKGDRVHQTEGGEGIGSGSGVSRWDGSEVDLGPVEAARKSLRGRQALPVMVSKASQLEAEALDLELTGMLKEQLARVVALIRPSVTTSLGPELDACFRCIIFSYSVWVNKPTPGATFLNLIYSSTTGSGPNQMHHTALTKRQRVMHAALYVALPYAWSRASTALGSWGWGSSAEGSWRRRAWWWFVSCEAAMRHMTLANFLLFLAHGKYRTFADRLVQVRLMYMDPGMTRTISLDYVGYFLAWQSFTQLLAFLQPIVSANAGGLRRRFMRIAGLAAPQVNRPRLPGVCHECGASPALMPHVPRCGHVYCYYCLKASMMAQPGAFRCGGCGAVAGVCVPATSEQILAGPEGGRDLDPVARQAAGAPEGGTEGSGLEGSR